MTPRDLARLRLIYRSLTQAECDAETAAYVAAMKGAMR
jgi:hypothetical protein